MSRLIQAEALAILKYALGEEAAEIAISGVDLTPGGPRLRFALAPRPRPRDPQAETDERPAVCELLSRTLALRWQTPSPSAPADSYVALTRLYPTVYTTTTETSAGWHWLLAATAEMLIDLGVPDDFHAHQVKEKFGWLRFYWGADDAGRDVVEVVEAAERLSGWICDTCGRPGRLRPAGWTRTACDEHARHAG